MSRAYEVTRAELDGSREMNKTLERLNYEDIITDEEYEELKELNYQKWRAERTLREKEGL